MPIQEGYMAKPSQSELIAALNRRQLLGSAALIAGTGVVLGIERAGAAEEAELLNAASVPLAETPAWNVCAITARRLEEIARRNKVRAEAGLPLLSIPKELRKMKEAADGAEFEAFAAVHKRAVWDEVLRPVRVAKGDSNWRPTSFMQGLAFQAKVSKVLHERFKIVRAGKGEQDCACSMRFGGEQNDYRPRSLA
jgi:hypothetical protein